jgi:hypothetical protein
MALGVMKPTSLIVGVRCQPRLLLAGIHPEVAMSADVYLTSTHTITDVKRDKCISTVIFLMLYSILWSNRIRKRTLPASLFSTRRTRKQGAILQADSPLSAGSIIAQSANR